MPLIHRILKHRVKKIVTHECLYRLRERGWDNGFGLHYLLGVMSRLYYFNPEDPYWNERTLRPLEFLFCIIREVDKKDIPFIPKTFPKLIVDFLTKHAFRKEHAYEKCMHWLLYACALRGKTLNEAVEILCECERKIRVRVQVRPNVLTELYWKLEFLSLELAEEELRGVVVVEREEKC